MRIRRACGSRTGRDFHITRLTFKNHVGCGHTFAAIDGALALQQQHGFSHADIESVHLGVYRPTLDVAPHVDPQTADQARFSLHYMVASALVHGSVRLSVAVLITSSPSHEYAKQTLREVFARLLPHLDRLLPKR